MAENISNHEIWCPVCKGKKVVRESDETGEAVRVHVCLRCYGSGLNKFTEETP